MRYWTYLEIKTKVQKDLDLEDEDFITESELLGYCNEAIDEAEGEIHTLYEDYFLDSALLPLMVGQSAYSLPTGIFASKLRGVIYNDGSLIYQITKFKETKKFLAIAEANNSTSSYYQYLLKNTIVPIPAAPSAWAPYSILEWVSGTSYVTGNQVTHLGNIYQNLLPTTDVVFELYHTTVFTETFAAATDFVFSDAAKIEITGGQVQQVIQTPTDASFWATFTTNANGTQGDGDLTGTLVGVATWENGRINCGNTGSNGVRWSDVDNNKIAQTGCIKFKYTPSYTGAPGEIKGLFCIGQGNATLHNRVLLLHTAGGGLRLYSNDSAGTAVYSNEVLSTWLPVAGVEYVIEFNIDATTPAYRLFIDGVPAGELLGGACTRVAGEGYHIILGNDTSYTYGKTGYFDDLILFDSVQHTADHSAAYAYTLPETLYAACEAALPDWELTTNIHRIYDLVPTSNGLERYTIQRCGSTTEFYFSGTGWVASNDTYAQANDIATFVANLATLSTTIADCCTIHIYFDDSNTLGYVSNLVGSIGEYEWLDVGATPNTYEVGDLVRYNNANYECAIANSNTTFTPANWTLLAPYPIVGTPAVQLTLVPASKETSTGNVTIWYIRNANRMALDEDICDIPEFTSFVIQYMKVRCYEKEQNENLSFATETLGALRKRMIDTLTNKEPDEFNEIEPDLGDYIDSTGV